MRRSALVDRGADAICVVGRVGVELLGVEVVEQHVDVRAQLSQRLAQVVGDGGGEAVEVPVRVAQPAGVGDEVVVVAGTGQGVGDELGDRLDELPARRRELDRIHPPVHHDTEQLAALEEGQCGQRGPVELLELLDEAWVCGAQLVERWRGRRADRCGPPQRPESDR